MGASAPVRLNRRAAARTTPEIRPGYSGAPNRSDRILGGVAGTGVSDYRETTAFPCPTTILCLPDGTVTDLGRRVNQYTLGVRRVVAGLTDDARADTAGRSQS